MATRSGVGGLAVSSNWQGAIVEMMSNLRGLLYGLLGIQRP